jgi:hypothetical protein
MQNEANSWREFVQNEANWTLEELQNEANGSVKPQAPVWVRGSAFKTGETPRTSLGPSL